MVRAARQGVNAKSYLKSRRPAMYARWRVKGWLASGKPSTRIRRSTTKGDAR
jgi:hypothetical protein